MAMQLVLNDGTILLPLEAPLADRIEDEGSVRATLTFTFDDSRKLGEMDSLFSESNCESLTIVDEDGNMYKHNGYTTRVSITKKSVSVSSNDGGSSVVVDRIVVVMAQRTALEKKVTELTQKVVDLQLAFTELYEQCIAAAVIKEE